MHAKFLHVGDVIRTLRKQHKLSFDELSNASGVSPSVISELEQLGPEVEKTTCVEWQALDRLAITFGLGNGVSLYRLIPANFSPHWRQKMSYSQN